MTERSNSTPFATKKDNESKFSWWKENGRTPDGETLKTGVEAELRHLNSRAKEYITCTCIPVRALYINIYTVCTVYYIDIVSFNIYTYRYTCLL